MSQTETQDQPKVFKLSAEWVSRFKRNSMIRVGIATGVIVVALIFLFAYLIVTAQDRITSSTILFIAPCALIFLIGTIAATTWVRIQLSLKMLNGYEIMLTGDTISMRAFDIEPVTLRRDEISAISESKHGGLMIRSQNKYRNFLIHRHVENYDQLRAILNEWRPISEKPLRLISPQVQAVIAVVLVVGICVSPTAWLTVPLWLLATGGLGYVITISVRHPDIKGIWKVFNVLVLVFVFVLITLRMLAGVVFTFPELLDPFVSMQ